ncbi:MAG: MltA domain-containing protein [Pseudomonadota bacterium]
MEAASISSLPGWQADALDGAIAAFTSFSVHQLGESWAKHPRFAAAGQDTIFQTAQSLHEKAARLAIDDPQAVRQFFDENFRLSSLDNSVGDGPTSGLVTGYFDPALDARWQPSETFKIPLYQRPADLINLVGEDERASGPQNLTHARQTANAPELIGPEPYATRAEIEAGALQGNGLELAYLSDAVDAFFLHVQGSGKLLFPNGQTARVTYDGKNGHPYTSIGAELIRQGDIAADDMTLEILGSWLRAHPDQAHELMQRNRSFVFFKLLDPDATDTAHGVLDTPLHPFRSLAVDTQFHPLGLPVYVSAPRLADAARLGPSNVDTDDGPPGTPGKLKPTGFHRLMFAHDVGSAIKGRHRGDIYFGSGRAAGQRAGATKHQATLTLLLPVGLDGAGISEAVG